MNLVEIKQGPRDHLSIYKTFFRCIQNCHNVNIRVLNSFTKAWNLIDTHLQWVHKVSFDYEYDIVIKNIAQSDQAQWQNWKNNCMLYWSVFRILVKFQGILSAVE